MIRYCLTERQKLLPCRVGWGYYGSNGYSSCFDEPQEENCRNLVDENSGQTCPYCGNLFQKRKIIGDAGFSGKRFGGEE